jgi:hypothetical protein
LKVLIIESGSSSDFFNEELDGPLTHHLTKLLGIDSKLVYGLNAANLKKAIAFAAKKKCDVLHVSCHGRKAGITLTDKTRINWPDFVQMFTANSYSPKALVMSSCWGAADDLADEFEKVKFRPNIIFGSTDPRYALQIIFEFKAPDIAKGEAQLMRYLSNEPMAKMGFWTNGTQTLAIYKRHQAGWVRVENASLPHPSDDLTEPPDEPPTWTTLREPSEVELAGALRRLVATVVISDPHVTRREDQLRELIHVLLVKLESDAVASRSTNINSPVAFRIYGDTLTKVAVTADRVREQFLEYFQKQRTRIFHPADRDQILLSNETIFAVVAELAPIRILGDRVDLLAKAFQIFRTSALKSGEGQYLTPLRVVRPAVMALEITSSDKVKPCLIDLNSQ